MVAAILGLLPGVSFGELREGAVAYSRGDFAVAIRELKPLAADGLPVAQYLLGSSLINANPPLENVAEGEGWLRKSAAQGHVAAARDLGKLNLFLKKDRAEARQWFLQGANRGDAESQHLMAVLILDGPDAATARAEAYAWLHLAAERGHLLSAVLLRETRPPFTAEERAEGLKRAGDWKPIR